MSSKWEHESGSPGKLTFFPKRENLFIKMILIARSFTLLHGHR